MRSVLVVHPVLAPRGGGNAVAAWTLEALRHEFRVALATLHPVDVEAVNRSFGTSLRPGDWTTLLAPRRYRRLLAVVRTRGAMLDCQLTVRLARQLDRAHRFDVLLSTHNEVDFGRRGIQYVNYPGMYLPGRADERGWSHRVPGLHAAFRAACSALGGTTPAGPLRNLFLADSGAIAAQIRSVYGIDPLVLYPPVPGPFPAVPWEARRRGFVAVGRITPAKRWEQAVDIVAALRRRGHDLTLTLLGHREDRGAAARLARLAASHPWFRMRLDVDRQELLAEIARHRYGIHPMPDEHFGIAPAEILAAGCLPFVHRSGGPAEIVGNEPALLFGSPEEAIARIEAVLGDPVLEARLRALAAGQQPRFSAETFCAALRGIVREFR